MNILIICHYFPPVNSSPAYRPYSWAKYWTEAGHRVVVLTTKKTIIKDCLNFKNNGFDIVEINWHGKEYGIIKRNEINYSNRNKIKDYFYSMIREIVLYLRKKYGIFAAERIPEIIYKWKKPAIREALNIHNKQPFDVVVSTYAPPSAHIIALTLKHHFPSIKWIADYRDLWTYGNYVWRGVFGYRLYERYLENKILKKADYITTVSPTFAKILSNKARKNVNVIENGYFDEKNINFGLSLPKGEIKLVYTGCFGGYRSIDFIYKFLEKLKFRDRNLYKKIIFYIIGEGDEFFQHSKIKHFGKVSYEKAKYYQRKADILFLVESDKEEAKGTLTGKLAEYFSARKPIIAFGPKKDFDICKYLKKTNSGLVSRKDYKSVYETIKYILKNYNRFTFKNIENFERKKLALKMLSLLENR